MSPILVSLRARWRWVPKPTRPAGRTLWSNETEPLFAPARAHEFLIINFKRALANCRPHCAAADATGRIVADETCMHRLRRLRESTNRPPQRDAILRSPL